MKLIDNKTITLRDDLLTVIQDGSKVAVAASCFSIYAYQELKERLKDINELRFIFTSPTFTTDKVDKQKREFYIPRLNRERTVFGSEFEIKLRNELTQRAIARECAEYIEGKKTPKKYRNSFLANAMVNLKMIDTQGYGIHEMFLRQRERYLPMPDYDRTDPTRVKLIVPGHVIDTKYSLLLMERADLDLTTAVLLDSVQKKKPIGDKAIAKLRKLKLIEGRKPNVFISQRIAGITHQEAEYTDMKGLDDKYYQDLIIEALTQHGKLKRADIDKLLLNKLPSILSQEQKLSKIGNMLTKLRRNNIIFNDKERYWRLVNNLSEKKINLSEIKAKFSQFQL